MKFTVILTLAILLYATCNGESVFERTFNILHGEPITLSSTRCYNVENKWIKQKLDNFNESDTRTWQMRYIANGQHFKPGGPIFIRVGGERLITWTRLTRGHMYDIAKEHGGYMYYTEHRYYGQSRPTSDLRTENLKYLNVKQALVDLAHFIRTMKSTSPGLKKSKVILVGGSYAGSMVIWFKRLYPDLIVGAWASSAPVFAKVNFIEYKEVVGRSIKLVGGDACYNRIQRGIAGLEEMITGKRAGEAKKLLNICNHFDETNKLDLWYLFSSISNIFAGIVQRHNHNSIQNNCSLLMKGSDDITGLANYIVSDVLSPNRTCHSFSYKSRILQLQRTNNTVQRQMRQWYFQMCNEFGWFQTSDSKHQSFGIKIPVDFWIATCRDAFGKQFTKESIQRNVDDTNSYFGGFHPNVQNVYITHGDLDPWTPMGITEKNKATVIPSYAHCKDFDSISSIDSAEMKALKMKIAELVRRWVKS